MRTMLLAGAAALALLNAPAAAGPVPDTVPQLASINPASNALPTKSAAVVDWLDDVAGKKLSAVDGSTLKLVPREEGIARQIVSSDGTEQDTNFAFLNDKLGTVSEGSSDVVGFFRKTDTGLEITYADGRLETIAITADGGVAMVLHTPDAASRCMGWYPQDHVFSESERRAALASYAKRLGLPLPGAKQAATDAACATAQAKPVVADVADPATLPKPTPPPAPAAKRRARHVSMNLPAAPGEPLAPISDIVPVRNSQVHPVDDAKSASVSNCLSVDSDGDSWGFRNACTFPVSFAYCLKNAKDDDASCDQGAESGRVSAHGFTPLLRETTLASGHHDFRWVACGESGGAVQPHLDQTSPPAGRCTRSS